MILNDKGEPFGAPFLVVASLAEVDAIVSMLDGMFPEDSVDDERIATEWIRYQAEEAIAFPARLSLEQLTTEMIAVIQAAIDNVANAEDDEGGMTPFTATITTR